MLALKHAGSWAPAKEASPRKEDKSRATASLSFRSPARSSDAVTLAYGNSPQTSILLLLGDFLSDAVPSLGSGKEKGGTGSAGVVTPLEAALPFEAALEDLGGKPSRSRRLVSIII